MVVSTEGEPDLRRLALSKEFGEPVAEWRSPGPPAGQYLVWGDPGTDAFGLPDNGSRQPSLLIYRVGKGPVSGAASGPCQGGMCLWDPVGIAQMRDGLRKVITHGVQASRANGNGSQSPKSP